MPLFFILATGAVGGFIAFFRETREEKHQRCLENIENLEFVNRCLDARNAQSQEPSLFSDVPTR